jgi:hypothetical protein
MVSATDYPRDRSLSHSRDEEVERPRKRFRLFSALAAPFRDMDERAVHKKRARAEPHKEVRNNSKGNMFTTRAAATPANVAVRRSRHGDD